MTPAQYRAFNHGKQQKKFKDNTTSINLHPIHSGMQRHFMAIVTHVLTMDIDLKIAGDIAGALTKGFIKDHGIHFLEDETESYTPIIVGTTAFLLHY